jgi:hypothetical protein
VTGVKVAEELEQLRAVKGSELASDLARDIRAATGYACGGRMALIRGWAM